MNNQPSADLGVSGPRLSTVIPKKKRRPRSERGDLRCQRWRNAVLGAQSAILVPLHKCVKHAAQTVMLSQAKHERDWQDKNNWTDPSKCSG